MPSRFPGMDPFVEGQVWEDFHHRFIEEVSVQLVPQIRPRYLVRVEKRVYLQLQSGDSTAFRADVAVMLDPARDEAHRRSNVAGSQTAVLPLTLTLPEPEEEIRESFLTIRDSESLELVTVIEILSPSNKRIRSSGRAAYLSKRNAVIRSDAHLVELDLLRGGLRLPTKEQQPLADYYAFVSRAPQRPKVDVYAWSLRQAMPTIPI